MFTVPYDVLLGEPLMKSPFFSLLFVFGTIAACTFFLWYGGTIAALKTEPGLKGVLNEKENTYTVSKPGVMFLLPLSGRGLLLL